MKKLITFSAFLVILAIFFAAKAQAQTRVLIAQHPSTVIMKPTHRCGHARFCRHHHVGVRLHRPHVRMRGGFVR